MKDSDCELAQIPFPYAVHVIFSKIETNSVIKKINILKTYLDHSYTSYYTSSCMYYIINPFQWFTDSLFKMLTHVQDYNF